MVFINLNFLEFKLNYVKISSILNYTSLNFGELCKKSPNFHCFTHKLGDSKSLLQATSKTSTSRNRILALLLQNALIIQTKNTKQEFKQILIHII
jgi:hypothetical protein